jgi:hypothetical protein
MWEVEGIDRRLNAMLDTLRPKLHPSVADAHKMEVMERVNALPPVERERFDKLLRERLAAPGRDIHKGSGHGITRGVPFALPAPPQEFAPLPVLDMDRARIGPGHAIKKGPAFTLPAPDNG